MQASCAIISDLHAPHEDEAAVVAALAVLTVAQPDVLIFNGDCIDFAPLSRFDQKPADALALQEDLDAGKALLKRFRLALPKAQLIYLAGNHEDRLQKYLFKHPEIAGLNCLQLSNLLDLSAFDCSLIEAGHYQWNDWLITHGDVVRGQGGQTGQALIQKYGSNGVCGHVHRLAQVQHRSYTRTLTWIEGGCLCRLDAPYLKVANWQQGFSLLTHDGSTTWAELIPITNGTARWRGLSFKTL